MVFRVKAFALHALASASVLTLILGTLYFGWYRWPGWYLTGVLKVLVILVVVDLLLGPTLTLIVANPLKARRQLVRDIGIIAAVQIAALVYGAATLWKGRPLYYSFSVDRLEMVQASELEPSEIVLAQRHNPALAPHWYSLPRWIWAPLPDDPDEAAKIVNGAITGNKDIIDMPRYFRRWEECAAPLQKNLSRVEDIKYLSKNQKASVQQRMTQRGLDPKARNAMIMWGGGTRVLAVLDPQSLKVMAILAPD